MRFFAPVVIALFLVGCNQSQDKGIGKASAKAEAKSTPILTNDISTPDRALKSYWAAKDAYRNAKKDFFDTAEPELAKLAKQIGFDNEKIMVGDALSFHKYRNELEKRFDRSEYNRDIVELKQETESRATVVVKVTNVTPLSEGAVLTDEYKKYREAGEKLKYVLEKDSQGWKVAQMYKFNQYRSGDEGKDPWEKQFDVASNRAIPNILCESLKINFTHSNQLNRG